MLRQELIGIALQMSGVTMPDKFRCHGYYSDAAQNDWVCRAAELAADSGLITRNNETFRPMNSVTRAEALSILMEATGILKPSVGADWQTSVLDQARKMKIISSQEFDAQSRVSRGEVFSIAHRLLESKDPTAQKDGQYVRYVSPIAHYAVTYPAKREIEENEDGSIGVTTVFEKNNQEISVAYIVGILPTESCEDCRTQ